MRNISCFSIKKNIAVFFLAVAGISLLTMPVRPSLLLYPLARQAVQLKIDYVTKNMLVKETDHFIIKYAPSDLRAADMVAQAAEAAYAPANKMLNYHPRKKPLIIVYNDRAVIHNAYGRSGDKSAMGFYWGGVIQVLSPSAWLNDKVSAQEFIKKGPLAHEYAHLALDYLVSGNYSRWFTEGLAQYVEYKLNGYEWLVAANSLSQKGYTMTELDKNFDGLPNQAMAYRQSLAIIRYIVETYGEDSFARILLAMKSGLKTDKAIQKETGLSYAELEEKVGSWAEKTMISNIN